MIDAPVDARVKRTTRRLFLKISVTGAAGLAVASALSACGGGSSTSAPAPTAAPAKPAEAAKPGEAAKPAAPAAPAAPVANAGPGGFSGGGSLSFLSRAHFVPAYDTWFDDWAKKWGQKNKVEVQVDHILSGEMASKIAAEIAANAGHDVIGLTRSGEVNLYAEKLVETTEVVKAVGEAGGGWLQPITDAIGKSGGVWKAVPEYFIEFGVNYRKDLFDVNNLQVPETWEDLLKSGAILKEKGNPIGIAINQKSNDANNSWTALMWCYGAGFVAADGKTVTINSPETKEAVKFAVELYNKTMTNEVLSWDDAGNNQGQASGRLSWIQNPISSLRTIEKQNPELAQKIFISLPPAGPKARLTSVSTNSFGITSWGKNQAAAKALLTEYFTVYADAVKASEAYNQPILMNYRKKPMPGLGDNPKLAVLQDFDQVARVSGYPGPPTPAAAEVESNWIIPLMIGQAVQNNNVDEAVAWADGKIKAIYDKYK